MAAELEAVLGGRLPEPGDLERLPALRQVVTEALRLYPPAWLMTLVATEPLTLGGHPVPQETLLLMAPWLLHRDGRFFEEPLAFRPERWAGPGPRALPRFAYFPFGGGPRVCIGEHFALMEVSLVLAVLLSRWSLALAPGARVELAPVLTLRARHGLPLLCSARPGRGA